jgi:hypothetical protein
VLGVLLAVLALAVGSSGLGNVDLGWISARVPTVINSSSFVDLAGS